MRTGARGIVAGESRANVWSLLTNRLGVLIVEEVFFGSMFGARQGQ